MVGARTERLVGHLAQAVSDGSLAVTNAQRAEVEAAQVEACQLALLLERCLLDHTELLDAVGIDTRVLKGPALAHSVYPDPSLRHFGDIDLLVPAGALDATLQVLTEAGCRRASSQPRPGFDERFGKGASLVTPAGLELDIHRRFVFGPMGLAMDTTRLFDEPTPFELGGRILYGLGAEHRFLHACFHAALGDVPPRLAALRDVAQLALTTSLDSQRVVEIARQWRAGLVVATAVTTAWQTLGLSTSVPLTSWASDYVPTTFERRSLQSYTSPEHSYAGEAVAGLRALPFPDRAAYVRALVLPQRRFLAGRRGYLQRFAKGVRLIAGRGS
jgi:hypothetical protein